MAESKDRKLSNPIEKQFNTMSRYHYYLYAWIFSCKLVLTWHVLSLLFLSPYMEYNCSPPDGVISNETENICPCDEPLWNKTVFAETLQTKYDLLCDKAWLISFSQSIFYCGLLVGAFLFGSISDRYGRLTSFCMSCLVLAIAGCLVSFMPSVESYTLLRSIEGIGAGGVIVTSFVLCIEFAGVRHRETVTALFHIPINLGHISLAGLSYLLRHSDELQLTLSIPMFIWVAMKWLALESPKWLMDNGNVEEAANVMVKFSSFNSSSSENIKEELLAFHEETEKRRGNKAKFRFWDVFKHRRLTVNLVCMSVIYFVCGMGYYGVSQFIGLMSGNIHLNVAISGSLMLPGTVASLFLLKTIPRRYFLMSTNLCSGIFMIIAIYIPETHSVTRVLFACFSNTCFFMSFIIVFLYGVELFPTTARNSVLGFLSVMSRIGQIIAPPINSLSETTAGTAFGAMAILGAVLCYPLPETKNTELPSSVEDIKKKPKNISIVEQGQAGPSKKQDKTNNGQE